MGTRRSGVRRDYEAIALPIWQELLVGMEMLYLWVSPVYWGFGIPHGDGSAVVLIPGFLGTDFYLTEFRAWLRRIGYRPYYSGIGFNADCPNLLIRYRLAETIQKAHQATGKKVHLIGHSLGGVIARAAASQMPDCVASVLTMGSPFRGVAAHPSVLRVAELVRGQILDRHSEGVLPDCYTGACTCDFLESLAGKVPRPVSQTAIFTKTDGIVDWRVCRTGHASVDVEVSGTHIGLVFNPIVYEVVARRLATAPSRSRPGRAHLTAPPEPRP
ncbi:MAG: alpha/beta fold hydrolase [Acidobacteriia bacterium]|nr:alpha/beta fold hydrolase [Terriglobia bacterium]